MTDRHTFEAEILEAVLVAARLQASVMRHDFSAVSRHILEKASKRARPAPDGVAHPAKRPDDAPRKRIRFSMDPNDHDVIKSRIRASGRSVTSVLERGLARYARTGKF